MFKALAFRSLSLVPNNIDLFFLGRYVHLIYYQQASDKNLENLFIVVFQFQFQFGASNLQVFLYKKNFYEKMSLKNAKALRKC